MDALDLFLGTSMIVVVVVLIAVVALWVWIAWSHMKAFKALGYDKAWLAWIPYGFNYALADCATLEDGEQINVIGNVNIPRMAFCFYWVISLVISFIPIIRSFSFIITTALNVVCMGYCYRKIFAIVDDTDEESVKNIAYLSGFCNFVAAFKFTKMFK